MSDTAKLRADLVASYRSSLEAMKRAPSRPAGFTKRQIEDLVAGFQDGAMQLAVALAREEGAAKGECHGHPCGPFDPMGETVYCDGSCIGPRRRTDEPIDLGNIDAILEAHGGGL